LVDKGEKKGPGTIRYREGAERNRGF
jgi:hypothetical protein